MKNEKSAYKAFPLLCYLTKTAKHMLHAKQLKEVLRHYTN